MSADERDEPSDEVAQVRVGGARMSVLRQWLRDGRTRGAWRLRRFALPAGATALLLVVGWQVANFGPAPLPSESAFGGRTFPAMVSVEATGAVSFSWSGEQEITLVRGAGPAHSLGSLTASALPQVLADRSTFRFGWQLELDGYTDKPGVFTIPPLGRTSQSTATLYWIQVEDPSVDAVAGLWTAQKVEAFSRPLDGCIVRLGPSARTGSFRCDRLQSDAGTVTKLIVSWNRP